MAHACVSVEKHVLLILLLCSGASGQCQYGRSLSISAPNLEALSGSCLLIPCIFTSHSTRRTQFDPNKPVTAIWSKTYPYLGRFEEISTVFYNSAYNSYKSPMTMIGDRREKNCTTLFSNITLFHSDQYYLRIENDRFKATALCELLYIKVQDSPWKPSVWVSGLQRENQLVTITCSAPTPCPYSPPKLTWSLHQNPLHTTVRQPDGTFTTSIQQTMTLSEEHDGLWVNCTAVYPVEGGEKSNNSSFSLRVDYSPKDTLVHLGVSTSLSVGQSVNLSCSSRARPPVNISWFRVTSEGPQRVHEGHVYNFIFNHSTQGQYFCQAKNRVGEQNSEVVALELEGSTSPWKLIVGGGVGLLMLICTGLSIWCLLSRRRSPQEPQAEIYAEVDRGDVVFPAETYAEVDGAEDTVHYGEIVFAKPNHNRSAEALEETVYSEVRVRDAASQDIYATVKKS